MIEEKIIKAADDILETFSPKLTPDVFLGAVLRLSSGMLASMTLAAASGDRPDLRALALATADQLAQMAQRVRAQIGGN